MNDKSKTTLLFFVGPDITLELCSHVIWDPTNKLDLIQLAVPHECGFSIVHQSSDEDKLIWLGVTADYKLCLHPQIWIF